MNTAKLILTVLVFLVAVLTGCSDYITSNPESLKSSQNILDLAVKHNGTVEVFVNLKPHQSYTIYSKDTNLPEFNSFRIEDTDIGIDDKVSVCDYLKISYSDSENEKQFRCFKSGIKTHQLNIQNGSNKLVRLKVTLTSNITKEQ